MHDKFRFCGQFVDDVMFQLLALWRVMCTPKRRSSATNITAKVLTKFILTGSTQCELNTTPAGVKVCYLRLTCLLLPGNGGRVEYDNSMVVSMEINGLIYQGVLFAQHQHRI